VRSLDATVDFFEGLVPKSQVGGYWATFERLLDVMRRKHPRVCFACALELSAHDIAAGARGSKDRNRGRSRAGSMMKAAQNTHARSWKSCGMSARTRRRASAPRRGVVDPRTSLQASAGC
jgi:hypothetical protein